MEATGSLSERGIILEGTFGGAQVHFRAARVIETFSQIPEIRVEFLTTEGRLDAPAMLGTRMRVTMNTDTGTPRKFQGHVVGIDYMGSADGFDLYGVDVRPWLWFLTRSRDNRIFQGLNVPDIIAEVLSEHGFSHHTSRLSGKYNERVYCVQYGETDLAFISRLMEEEGIYYYFDHSGDDEKLVLSDGIGSHDPVAGGGTLEFKARSRNTPREGGHVFEWFTRAAVVSGRLQLIDYNFEKPTADLTAKSVITKGSHPHNKYERYEIDGRYQEVSEGEEFARVRMEADAHRALRYTAVANAPDLGVGRKFGLKDEPKLGKTADFLVISAVHFLHAAEQGEYSATLEAMASERRLRFPDYDGRYICRLEVAPVEDPFRPPQVTPWPDISGLHTAVVVGPQGEEIYTDKYGRIKVQFHWDRQGRMDEKSTCWVRTVVPWSGRGWGMFGVPRIGQEVVIQFERGNPDRPVCTGMLYNANTMHAVGFPDNKTISGVRTNASKGGGGYHEFVFEDKKGAEYVRMISERDYFQTIKNNAVISIGQEKKSNGDLTQTIHRHKTETLKTGNHTFTVQSGSQKIKIAKDHDEEIGGTSDTRVKGDTSYTVQMGDYAQTIEMGDSSREVKMGNDSTKVSMGNMSTEVSLGNISIDATLGKITITALQEILLKVGTSSVKVSQLGVDIEGIMIKVNGKGMVTVKAPLTQVNGDGLLMLKGGLTMIN
jgi:type VI secretion system secreted protein VgrG